MTEEDLFEVVEDEIDDPGAMAIAYELLEVARALDRLGNNAAFTKMGAVEHHAFMTKQGFKVAVGAISELSDEIAAAIRGLSERYGDVDR